MGVIDPRWSTPTLVAGIDLRCCHQRSPNIDLLLHAPLLLSSSNLLWSYSIVSGELSANKFTLNLNVVRDKVQVKPKPIIRFRKIPHKNFPFIFVLFLDLCVLDLNSYICFWHVERPSRGGWQEGLESSQELPIFPPTFIPWFGRETFHHCSDFDFSPVFVLLCGFRCD